MSSDGPTVPMLPLSHLLQQPDEVVKKAVGVAGKEGMQFMYKKIDDKESKCKKYHVLVIAVHKRARYQTTFFQTVRSMPFDVDLRHRSNIVVDTVDENIYSTFSLMNEITTTIAEFKSVTDEAKQQS